MRRWQLPRSTVGLALAFAFLIVVGAALTQSTFAGLVGAGLGGGTALFGAIGLAATPWLASRSSRAALVCAIVALAAQLTAAILLATSPASNSAAWFPINAGRFLGLPLSIAGVTLMAHASLTRQLDLATRRRVLAATAASIAAGVINIAFSWVGL